MIDNMIRLDAAIRPQVARLSVVATLRARIVNPTRNGR